MTCAQGCTNSELRVEFSFRRRNSPITHIIGATTLQLNGLETPVRSTSFSKPFFSP